MFLLFYNEQPAVARKSHIMRPVVNPNGSCCAETEFDAFHLAAVLLVLCALVCCCGITIARRVGAVSRFELALIATIGGSRFA